MLRHHHGSSDIRCENITYISTSHTQGTGSHSCIGLVKGIKVEDDVNIAQAPEGWVEKLRPPTGCGPR